MNINNMSDEELDNLFRESAENFEPPFDPDAWQAMEQKLEKTGGGVSGTWRVLPLVLLILLISSPPLYDLMNEEQEQHTINLPVTVETDKQMVQQTLPASNAGAVTGEAKLPGENSSNRSNPTPVAQAALPVAPVPGSKGRQQTTAGSAGEKKRWPIAAAGPKPGYAENLPATVMLLHGADKVKSGAADLPASLLQPDTASTGKASETTLPPGALVLQPADAAPDTVSEISQQDSAAEVVADVAPQTESRKRPYFLKHMQVMLAVAPDLTTVKFKDPGEISPNAGLLVGVSLSRRVSLVSGVLWSDKRYGALPGDYAPSSGYWDGKHLPDYIDATCKVLDIPLNIRWLVLERGKNLLTVQAGLSSYIMLNEEYQYNYERYVSYPYTKTYAVENENRHWFAVQNFSVGYSRKISNTFSVGAEPFVKIPLSGIGAGNVKLTSAGLLLTAGYTIDLKK